MREKKKRNAINLSVKSEMAVGTVVHVFECVQMSLFLQYLHITEIKYNLLYIYPSYTFVEKIIEYVQMHHGVPVHSLQKRRG